MNRHKNPASQGVQLSEAFEANLRSFGASEDHLQALAGPETHRVDGFALPYSKLTSPVQTDRAVFYVPGFSENPVSNAPFGVALANSGYDVILPGHPKVKKSAGSILQSRAHLYEDLMSSLRPDYDQIDVVTHSMGNLVLQHMIGKDLAAGKNSFQDATVVMLAPSGLSAQESVLKLGLRNAKNMKMERSRPPQEFSDDGKDMEKSCFDFMLKNPRQVIKEVRELANPRSFDPNVFVQAGVSRIALVGYANDPLYSDDQIARGYTALTESGVDARYVTPIKLDIAHTSATHNDEQSNPSRVLPTVLHYIES
jgi:esterase/lipase